MRLSISHFYPQVSALLILAASLAGSCVTAFSAEVRLAWDAKTEPEIVGYKIYYQGVTQSDLRSIDVGNVTTYTVTGLDPDTYGFCVTAYDTSGNETGGSNIVSTTLSPPMYGFRDENASSPVDQLAGVYGPFERFRLFASLLAKSTRYDLPELQKRVGTHQAVNLPHLRQKIDQTLALAWRRFPLCDHLESDS